MKEKNSMKYRELWRELVGCVKVGLVLAGMFVLFVAVWVMEEGEEL